MVEGDRLPANRDFLSMGKVCGICGVERQMNWGPLTSY
jgi:hypothetical protein